MTEVVSHEELMTTVELRENSQSEDVQVKLQTRICVDININSNENEEEKTEDSVNKNISPTNNTKSTESENLGSDSEDEDLFPSTSRCKIDEQDVESKTDNRITFKRKARMLVDSDSEDELNTSDIIGEKQTNDKARNESKSSDLEPEKESSLTTEDDLKNKKSIQSRFESLIDSDSEVEEEEKDENKESTETVRKNKHKINSKSKSAKEEEKGSKSNTNTPNGFQTLIDSESENEEEHSSYTKAISTTKSPHPSTKSASKRKVSQRASKDEAMKQIHSENQRLIRESEVSLPYHRPKQRTLQEFLNRRKIINVLPKAPTMAAKVKMSSEIVRKLVEEREKEAELFYKSSDSEEEEDQKIDDQKTSEDVACSAKNLQEPEESTQQNLYNTDVEKMEKVESAAIPNETGKHKEEIQKLSCALPRKLFDKNFQDIDMNCSADNLDEIENSTSNNQELHEVLIDEQKNEKNINTNEIKENEIQSDRAEKELLQIDKDNDTMEIDAQNTSIASDKETILNQSNESEKENDLNTSNKNTEQSELNTSGSKVNKNYAEMMKESLGLNAEESDEYNGYGLPPPVLDDEKPKSKKLHLLNLPDFKPQLKGGPGSVIDLSGDVKPSKKGVDTLLDRFFCKHSKMHKPEEKANVTAPHVKESLSYDVPDSVRKLNKPGASWSWLKQELWGKIAEKRDEEWKKKHDEYKEDEEEWDEEREETLKEDEIEDLTETEESEPEENDVCMKEKKKKKCELFDDEAEVSEDENPESVDINEENTEDEEDLLNEESNSVDTEDFGKKKLKRIIKPASENSCLSENDSDDENYRSKNMLAKRRTDVDMFETGNGKNGWNDDDDIPVSQIERIGNQICRTPQTKSNILDLISPATQLTALNTKLDSAGKDGDCDPFSLVESISVENTPVERTSPRMPDPKKKESLQKKLFDDSVDAEDLMKLCSGKFPTQKNDLGFSKEANLTESQLLDLCSGTFSTQPPVPEPSPLKNSMSQEIKTSSMEDLSSEKILSPVKQQLIKTKMSWGTLRVVSSDEESEDEKPRARRKKKTMKLDLSDDEDRIVDTTFDEAEEEENEDKFIDYDSEENEVVVPKKNIKEYAAGFLENEAELSESDWEGSADEDEQDLDKLEIEEADEEDIDENKVRSQLEKIHMRQILDTDQREVRILKELLFEDGDLHTDGSGRERKFRWKNIDKMGGETDNSEPAEGKDGWLDLSDDENEVARRKLRHEREKFLSEKMKNMDDEIEEDLNDSEIFKLGMKVLKKMNTNRSIKEKTSVESVQSTEPRLPHTISEILDSSHLEGKSRVLHSVMQKRSLLARGESTLAQIAALAKQRDTSTMQVRKRNFVFAHIDRSETEEKIETETKQEADVDSKFPYRKRKHPAGSTPRTAKRPRVENKGKKSF